MIVDLNLNDYLKMIKTKHNYASCNAHDINSDVLLICFSSALPLPNDENFFEWTRLTADLNVKRLYIRDIKNSFYLLGMDGKTPNIISIKNHLETEIKAAEVKRVITIGGSMGGYGAILYGCLLGVDKIIATAPYTNISSKEILRHYKDKPFIDGYYSDIPFDLQPVVEKHKPSYLEIHTGNYDRDITFAKRVSPTYHVIHPEPTHYVTNWLSNNGKLKQILMNHLNIQTSSKIGLI